MPSANGLEARPCQDLAGVATRPSYAGLMRIPPTGTAEQPDWIERIAIAEVVRYRDGSGIERVRASSPIRSESASNMPILRPRARLPHVEGLTVPPRVALVRAFAASLSGTALEWYDFAIYNVAAAVVFGRLFFPSSDPLTGTLLAFSTYAVGYL